MGVLKRRPATFIQGGEAKAIKDWVAAEGSYELYINDTLVGVIVVSPSELEAHALGYVVTEGLVKADEVESVERQVNKVIIRTSMKKSSLFQKAYQKLLDVRRDREKIPVVSSSLRVTPSLILQCAHQIFEQAENWKKTGGVHISLLFNRESELIKAAEDIGRHNSVDKVVGHALLHKVPLDETVLACSGRQPEEMVLKVARARIPIVLTKAAVTDKGIDAAERLGVTLIGFAREDRFTIYAHPQRVGVVV